jgi:hypothetical protein
VPAATLEEEDVVAAEEEAPEADVEEAPPEDEVDITADEGDEDNG